MISSAKLLDAGLTSSAISRRVAAGRLHPRHRGVYAVGHTAPSFAADLWAATLACGPRTTISSWSAGAVLDLCPQRLPIHVTVPDGRGRHHCGLVVHDGTLAPSDVVVRGGLRLTSWARTMLDISADATLDESSPSSTGPRPSVSRPRRRCWTSSRAGRVAAEPAAFARRS